MVSVDSFSPRFIMEDNELTEEPEELKDEGEGIISKERREKEEK